MNNILAIETATDACSVAWSDNGRVQQRHEIAPRQHNQRLFAFLAELLPSGHLREHGIEAVAYGCGPGSFTGLRIAASAVQGLTYATGLPAIAVSTLAVQAQTACRQGLAEDGQLILSTLDARINEVYSAWFRVSAGKVCEITTAQASSPDQVQLFAGAEDAVAIGSGCQFLERMPVALQHALSKVAVQVVPEARDLITLASDQLQEGEVQAAAEVQPVYVRDEINWKKIPQQGKQP